MQASLRYFFKKSALIVSIVMLSACATTENYSLAVYSWQGVNINTLYTQWGYPNSTQELGGGNKLITYHRAKQITTPTTITHSDTGDHHQQGAHSSTTVISPSQTTTYRCNTTFEVNSKQIIINTSFKGNDCTADESFVQSHGYAPALPQQNTNG